MSSLTQTPPHGVRAIQQIRGRTGPSARQIKVKNDMYNYFLTKVDPVVGSCITHLLCEQPADVASAMIEYFSAYTGEGFIPESKNSATASNKPRKELRLFLATNIAPIVSKLVNRVAVSKPENVTEFMCEEIKSMMAEGNLAPDATEAATAAHAICASDTAAKPADSAQPKVPVKKAASVADTAPVNPAAKTLQIAMLGCASGGKTSIINHLQGSFPSAVKPTIGFRPVSLQLSEDIQIKFYDLGGGKRIRDIWDQYYHDAHAFIYVFDSSAAAAEMEEAKEVFHKTVNHQYVKGKPLLVFANKQDVAGALSAEALRSQVMDTSPEAVSVASFQECFAGVQEEVPEDLRTVDPRIESALESLFESILEGYDSLHNRVLADSKLKAAGEAKKRFERERKVLKSKIASAFVEKIDPAILETMNVNVDPESIFSEEEGLDFLAAEIGEEGGAKGLADIPRACAAQVGYQRLALQMIGSLKVPISKKKVPLSWDEIHSLLVELRDELGLGSI